MNFIKAFGYFVEGCTSAACTLGFDSIIKPTGVKFFDKVIVPTGTFCMTYAISTKVMDVIVDDMTEVKESIDTIRECNRMDKKLKEVAEKMKENTKKMFEPELADKLNGLLDDAMSGKISHDEYASAVNKIKADEAKKAAAKTGKTPEEVLKEAGISTDILKED